MEMLRRIFVPLSVLGAVLLPAYFAVAGLGVRFGWWDIRTGLLDMSFTNGPLIILGALGLSVVALLLALIVQPRAGVGLALLALLVPLAGFIGTTQCVSLRYPFDVPKLVETPSYPPIHDVSTDLIDAPVFTDKMMALRGESSNAIELPETKFPDTERMQARGLAGKTRAEVQAASFPDIVPIHVAAAKSEDVYVAAVKAVKKIGLELVTEDKAGGIIEGTSTSLWYGFKDDVVVRIRPFGVGDDVVVDVRSVSRVGGGDMGANGKRVRKFTEALEAQEIPRSVSGDKTLAD